MRSAAIRPSRAGARGLVGIKRARWYSPLLGQRDLVTECEGLVEQWQLEEGWGILEATVTPGGCWVHFSALSHVSLLHSAGSLTLVCLGWACGMTAHDPSRSTSAFVAGPGRVPSAKAARNPLANLESPRVKSSEIGSQG